ncbi:hypothetical protein COU74_02785 [Candidatus Peregrinibacteria bacterium CG10_big_fil_rev_8_21_14_0_10_36_19]|nr:MAG: hypothetical protein COU74_02785 [Candidatus Peregrinibacteria bacterium CG10_big_fil_rev_8_21_14_0_10_36_19]
MKIDLKKVKSEDWKLIEDLEKKSHSPLFSPLSGENEYRKHIEEGESYIILKDKTPIGTVSYKENETGVLFFRGVTVLPEYRNQGLAKQAMNILVNQLKGQKLGLVTHPHNIPALLIYLRLGFVIKEWKENYFGDGEPRLYLEKSP